jgi:hypothetical protein
MITDVLLGEVKALWWLICYLIRLSLTIPLIAPVSVRKAK